MFEITQLRHAYPERAGFFLNRPKGYGEYTFLHFFNSVQLRLGDQVIKTEPHAIILFDIGTPQCFKSESPLIHDWMHFKGALPSLVGEGGLQLDTVYYPRPHAFLTQMIRELESEFYGDLPSKEKLLELKAQEFFIKLDRAVSCPPAAEISAETEKALRYLRGEMFSSLEMDWTVEEMAKRIALSPSRIYPIYKKVYGISPMADLINARINSAKNMLSFGGEKVEEIAWRLGYQNTTHFIRQFKQKVGCTPAQYRKEQIADVEAKDRNFCGESL
ncbi:MAG: helix-turn-helix transcriptional regulator [Clostridia bacterium]|nr:helix-turn-helix transcriptional regulator [Clostridia bacterium]